MALETVYAGPSRLVYAIVERELSDNGVALAGHARSLADLVATCRDRRPDVVVTDLVLGDVTVDSAAISALHSHGARVLLLCDDHDPAALTAALFAGASGYLLLRDSTPRQLTAAVEAVAKGDAVLHPAVAAAIVEQWRRDRAEVVSRAPTVGRVEFGARELEVLAAMADGLSTKAIAARLEVSTKTIESHKTRIFSKLGAKNQAHAVAIALESQLLPTPSHDGSLQRGVLNRDALEGDAV